MPREVPVMRIVLGDEGVEGEGVAIERIDRRRRQRRGRERRIEVKG
jgi:hypothetical protein